MTYKQKRRRNSAFGVVSQIDDEGKNKEFEYWKEMVILGQKHGTLTDCDIHRFVESLYR